MSINRRFRLRNARPLQLAKQIAQAALEKKAEDVTILDLTQLDTVTDYFVICTGEVNQQVKAIATHIEKSTRETLGEKAAHREGMDALNWVLIDYIDVVVHVFRPSFRDYYRLEDLWSDAKVIEVVDQAASKSAVKESAKRTAAIKKKALVITQKSAAKKQAVKKKTAKKAAKKAVKKAVKKAAKKVTRRKRDASA